RADQRQHRHRPRASGIGQGLPPRAHHARHDERGAPRPPRRLRRDARAHARHKGMHGAIRKAEEMLAEHPDWYMPQQFTNPANPEVHRRTTAPEILAQLPQVDAFVAGVGTGGTITGVGQVLRSERPDVRIYAVEPAASAVLAGGEPGFHRIQGIGAGFVPEILDTAIYDEVIAVSDEDAVKHTRALARYEGLLVGISSGAACAAAIRVARKLGRGAVVLTVVPDTGERYLTTALSHAEGVRWSSPPSSTGCAGS